MGLGFSRGVCKIGQREIPLLFLVSDIFTRPFHMPFLPKFHVNYFHKAALSVSQLPISPWPSQLFILLGLS